MARVRLGLDIGHRGIKLVQLERRGKGALLRSLGEVKTPPRTITKGRLAEGGMLQASLNGLVESHNLKGARTVIGLTHPEIIVKKVNLPLMNEKELAQAIGFELPDLVTFPFNSPSEVTYSWNVLGRREEDQEVLFVACRKNLIMPYVELARRAGLEVEVVDLSAFAIAKAYGQGLRAAFIDIGHVQTSICVASAGQYLGYRILPLGGLHFTHGVVEAYGVDESEAERLKAETPIDQLIAQGTENRGALRGTLQQLIGGILQTLDYVRAQRRVTAIGEILDQVVLCGATSQLPGLAELLNQELEIEVVVLDPFAHFGHKGGLTLPKYRAGYAAAAGLAWRGCFGNEHQSAASQ